MATIEKNRKLKTFIIIELVNINSFVICRFILAFKDTFAGICFENVLFKPIEMCVIYD